MMSVERALVQILDAEGCVVGWALRTTDVVGAAGGGQSLLPVVLTVTGTATAAGVTPLVAAPAAGSHTVVRSVYLRNDGSAPITVQVRDGATAKHNATLQPGSALRMAYPTGGEWALTSATALNLNLSAAGSVAYEVDYWTATP